MSLNRVLNKKHFHEKIIQKQFATKLVPDHFLILVKNSKQPLDVRNLVKNKRFSKRIIKKP